MSQQSNEDRLRKARVIHSDTKLSREQQAAINEMSSAEVDQLIALNAKLAEKIPSARGRAIVEVIGRNGKKHMDDQRGFLSSFLNWLKRLFRG